MEIDVAPIAISTTDLEDGYNLSRQQNSRNPNSGSNFGSRIAASLKALSQSCGNEGNGGRRGDSHRGGILFKSPDFISKRNIIFIFKKVLLLNEYLL